VQFFNFRNEPTFHFFEWVRATKDTKKLIAEAYDACEGDEWFEMGEDVSRVARDKLADRLEEILEEAQSDWGLVTDEWSVGDVDLHACAQAGTSLDALFLPLLSFVCSEILCCAVAEALLRDAGKWPQMDIPEIE
jgi:hypothetical protein